MTAAIDCRTSTTDQNPENQARELRQYADAPVRP
jgi:DNA invertase Pin-like site-specific DNA recombinase